MIRIPIAGCDEWKQAARASAYSSHVVARVPALLAVALGLALSVTACSAPEPSAAVGPAFAQRASELCRSAVERKQAWEPFPDANFDPAKPDPTAFPVVARWLEEQVTPTFETWLADLRALGTPSTGEDSWNALLGATEAVVQANAEQVAAAKTGDVEAFAAATGALRAIQPTLERAATAVGAPVCAEVHG